MKVKNFTMKSHLSMENKGVLVYSGEIDLPNTLINGKTLIRTTVTPKLNEFENRLTVSNKKYRVGICWRSGIINPERNPNNTSLLDWGSIFNLKNFEFVNLQYGECELELKAAEERFDINILRWSDLNLKDDIDKTLSLISRLDFVISIGSAVFSMAASVGVKVFVLLPRKTWDQFGTSYYPFFPNVEVFSPLQSDIQAEALKYVAERIEEMTSQPEDELQLKN